MSVVLFSGLAFSQSNSRTPDEIAGKRADKMKERLGLTDDQHKQVYSILLNHAAAHSAEMDKLKSMDKESRRAYRQKMREDLRIQISGVLTKDQTEKFNRMLEKKKSKNKNRKASEKPQ